VTAIAPLPSPNAAPPGRFRRVLGGLAATFGLTFVFAGALVLSVVVHLDLAPTRRVVSAVANEALGSLFKGKIVVGVIDRLNLHGLTVRSATALDPRGVEVARLDGLRADLDVVGLVKSALGKGDLTIAVPLIHLDGASVNLDPGPDGRPSIAEAFLLAKEAPPPPPGARNVRVALDRIELDHVTARGQVAPSSPVDAELKHLVASVQVTPEGVDVEVQPTRIEARAPVPQPLAGDARFQIRVPSLKSPTPGPPAMAASFDGRIGDVDVHAGATFAGAHLTGKVEIPRATAATIASFIPGPPVQIPLRVPVAVTAGVDGDLPELAVETKVTFEGGGSVDVTGKLTLASPLRLDTTFGVHALDPRVALEVPSASPLDATGHVKLEAGGGDVHINVDALTRPLQIGGNVIPAIEAEAELLRGAWHGSARVAELGAPTTATFSFDKAAGLVFAVDSRVASVRAITRLRAPVDGNGRVKVTGSLRDGELDAHVDAHVGAVRASGAELDDATVKAHVHGPVTALSVDASVDGRGLRAAGYAWEKVDVHASGPLSSLKLSTTLDAGGGESITASGALDTGTASVRGVRVRVKRGAGELDGEVARVSAAPGGGVAVEGVALHGEGVGQLAGGLTVRGKEIVGKLRGTDVDIEKVLKIAGVHVRAGGLANVDVDLSSSGPGQRRGHVAVEIQDGEVPGLNGVSALLTASFEGARMHVDGLVRVVAHATPGEAADERCDGPMAQLRVTHGEARLGGGLLDPDTWRRASGKVEIAAEEWNLRCLARLVPLGMVVSSVRGKLTARATVERAPGQRLPSVTDLLARTRGLEVDGPIGDAGPDWESHIVDVEVKGSLDGVTGKTRARVAIDDGVEVGSIGASATLDLPVLIDHPDQRWASLQKAPLSATVRIPRRSVSAFGSLPSFVRKALPPLDGDVELNASVKGSISDPFLVVTANAWGLAHVLRGAVEPPLREQAALPAAKGKGDGKAGTKAPVKQLPPPESPWGLPIDATAVLSYNGLKATLDAHVKHEDKEVLAAGADLSVSLADLLAGHPVRPTGSMTAKLTEAPVGEVPFLSDHGIEGHLNGTVALAGLGTAPTLAIDLTLPDLKIGRDLTYDTASLKLDIARPRDGSRAPERGSATMKLELASKTGGKLEAAAVSEVLWQNGIIPTLDEQRPVDTTTTATRFRIAALAPFVAGAVSSIDGVLDGKAHVDWTHRTPGDKPNLSVEMKLVDGVFHIPQLGQELNHAELSLTGGKGGIVQVERIHAEGSRGRITGSGRARFDGLRFVRAEANFKIKPGEELPLTFEGVPYGDAHGDVTVIAESAKHDLAITVGIPNLHIDLPAATARAVQGLDPNPRVEILQEPRHAVLLQPEEAGKLTLVFNIGLIEVVKGNTLDVGIAGVKGQPLTIEVSDKARISGDLQVARGRLDVFHKEFVVEQGIVHMRREDAADPYVNVTARWDSPDGPIFIEYAGLLSDITKPEKIKYRSPSIPDDKIMATILFGGVEQSTVGTGNAGVPGGGLIAQLIAQQLSTQIAGNVSTSISASDDGTLRPGLVYNAGNKVIELSTYGATGQSTGAGVTTAKGQHTLVTIDWRFWRNWLLRGKVDVGSDQTTLGGDVLWQYHY
jgi:translocation and assembly module TamB